MLDVKICPPHPAKYPTWSKLSHLIKNIPPDQEKTKIDADNTDVWVPPLLPQWQRSVRINFDCCAQIRFDNALRGFTCFWKTPNQRLPELPQTEHLLSCFSAHFSEDCDSHSTLYYFLKILRPSRHFLPFLQPHSEMERLPADLWQFCSKIVCLWTWFCPNFNSKIFSTWWDPSSNPLFSTAHTDVEHCLRQLLP